MKKIVLAMLLVAAVTAVAQTTPPPPPAQAPPAPAQATPQGAAPAVPAPQKKEIKDPAEYNAYVGAVQQKDAAAKVSGLEAFVTQYPNSVMKEDALEALMIAYQQTGNQGKMIDSAQKVLLVNPCNLRALAVLAFSKRAMAEANQNPQQNFAESGQFAEKGLQCLPTVARPEGTTPEEWEKLKSQTKVIFSGAAGTAALLQAKDYAKAQQFLRAEVEADPNNLVEVYHLALAYLAAGPTEKDVDGLFFIARAVNLQTGAGKDAIAKFGKSKYVKYHGSEEGWTALLAQTASTPLPPADFTIAKYVPPTPAEQCADLLKTKKVEEMSFAEWQLCLSEGKPEDGDKVWSVLKGKPLQMVAHVISIDSSGKATKLQLAGSSDDIDAKKADIDLTMSAAIPAKDMPKEDTDFQFQGTPVSYVAKPFVVTMSDGALLVTSKPKPKPPIHKKPAPH